VGTPYRLQVENAFDYVVNKLGVKNPAVGIIYQNDEYGQDGLTGYKEAVSYYHLHDVGQATYAATDTSFTAQVSQLKAAGAKYVFLTAIPTVTAGIIGTAYQLGYNPQWILQSPAFALGLLAVPPLVPLLSKAWLVAQGATWGIRACLAWLSCCRTRDILPEPETGWLFRVRLYRVSDHLRHSEKGPGQQRYHTRWPLHGLRVAENR